MAPKFQYQAKDGPHKVVEGVVEAEDHGQVVRELIRKGWAPIAVKEDVVRLPLRTSARPVPASAVSGRVQKTEIVLFTRQMSDLLEASVPLFKALQLVAGKTRHKEFRKVIEQIAEGIRNGASFSGELDRYPGLFSSYYVNMVRSGEMAGKLEDVLGRLADSLEKEREIYGKVQASLAYPLFILGIGLVVIFILLSFVIPRFVIMFEDAGQVLPLPTLWLMGLSGFLAQFWWLVGLGAILGGSFICQWMKSEPGRAWLDAHMIRCWIVGPFIRVVETGRFARTLGTLADSGIAIVSALEIAKDTVGNAVLKRELSAVSAEVLQGMPLSQALKAVSFFPEAVASMISVGEETGNFAKGLYKIADVYEREAEQMMKTGLSLLGPVVLTGVISVIGFIVIAVMLPIMQIVQIIR